MPFLGGQMQRSVSIIVFFIDKLSRSSLLSILTSEITRLVTQKSPLALFFSRVTASSSSSSFFFLFRSRSPDIYQDSQYCIGIGHTYRTNMYTSIETSMFRTDLNTGRTGHTDQFRTIPVGTGCTNR